MAGARVDTRENVRELLELGLSQNEIAERLGITKSTVSYHKRRLGYAIDERCNRRYDWAEVQRYYDEGHSMRECRARFGFAHETWQAARRRGDIVTTSKVLPIGELLAAPRNRTHVKQRLIRAGLKENRCEICGIDSWRGRELAMCLHHVNGDKHDNRLENLQLLCPNCHAQTDNFSGRNRGRGQPQAA